MKDQAITTQANTKAPAPPRARRISPRVRLAIKLRVEKGLTGEEAARVAGLSSAGFWKAWVQPHVQQLYEDMKAQYIQRVTSRRDVLKARALEVAEELLGENQPAAVRARMVEFLAGEPRNPGVVVQVNQAPAMGYAYRKPDSPSAVIEGQAIENKGNGPEVD